MELSGLHLLLSYQCNYECDHCFVWGSPWQRGTMTLADVDHILRQAQTVPTVTSIYFEGGEPFLYYAMLVHGVRSAAAMGFEVGIVSNAYWATGERDARECLRPLADLVADLSLSEDAYHGAEEDLARVAHARAAAEAWNIPVGAIAVAQPETSANPATGQLPRGQSSVMYRGRAAQKLAPRAPQQAWEQFTACPYEDLREPGRVHVDPLGYLHICQGITIGNLFHTPLRDIVDAYDPNAHPITGPLLEGGPVALAQRYGAPHKATYAGACHLCYETRQALRGRFGELLGPDQMYGIM